MTEEEQVLVDGQNGSAPKSIPQRTPGLISGMEDAFLNKLRSGAIFLKHGQRGNPHYRAVWAEDDLSCINWGDLKRKKIHGRIYTQSLIEVIGGHDSKVFARADKNSDPNKCFSLITANRTLDLEGISEEQRETWMMAFKFLLEYYEGCGNDGDPNLPDMTRQNSQKNYSKSRPSKSRHSDDEEDYDDNPKHSNDGIDSPTNAGSNLLDLINTLNERLEKTDGEVTKQKKSIEQWKADNRVLYMSAVKRSLETQQVIDALKYHEDILLEENTRLTQQFNKKKTKVNKSSPSKK